MSTDPSIMTPTRAIRARFPDLDLPKADSRLMDSRLVGQGGVMQGYVGASRAVYGWPYVFIADSGRVCRTNRTLCIVERRDGTLSIAEAC